MQKKITSAWEKKLIGTLLYFYKTNIETKYL